MPIWRIGKIGTSCVTIEEADVWDQACRKAGWEPKDCEVVNITETIRILMKGRYHRKEKRSHEDHQ